MPLSVMILTLLFINALMECVSRIIVLWLALKSQYLSPKLHTEGESADLPTNLFISAHIAIHNEPPEVVIATINAIIRSVFLNYEVIVIDNNTIDIDTWRPVEEKMSKLGDRFRFFHFDSLSGAKAGALNVALDHMHPLTTHVAVIDADYQVLPTFFLDALQAAVFNGVDYVQFPQAYRGVSVGGRGVEQELGDYFACFAYGSGRSGSMLPTGTLSLFSARALRAVGGWNAGMITEDAELGVRLQSAGFRGLWKAERAGHGLLPMDFHGLAKQRSRWAAGNMQVLRQIISKPGLNLSAMDLLNLIAQLTAWISFWGLPAAALALVAVFPHLPLSTAISDVAAYTIVFSFVLTFLRMAMLVEPQQERWRINLSALETKIALTWTSAFAWIPAVLNRPLRFYRTPKLSSGGSRDLLPFVLFTSVAFGLMALAYQLQGQTIEAIACGLLAMVWTCARSTDQHLRAGLHTVRI